MARPQLSFSRHMASKRKKLKVKKQVCRTQKKRPLGLHYNTKQENLGNSGKCKSKRMLDMIGHHSKYKSCVMDRANEVLANLEAEFPSFVKSMLPSHVSGGFWLGLPRKFCVTHLPKHDDTVILEDESGVDHITKFLVDKTGLSGGWRGFSIAHKLLAGDALVFQLVEPAKMKVHIVRSNDFTEVDGALGLLNLDSCANRIDFENHAELDIKPHVKSDEMCCEPVATKIPQETIPMDGLMISINGHGGPITDHSENKSEDFGSEVLEGIRLSESLVDFKKVDSIENFTIHFNGLVIDSEFSEDVRTKYYELCYSQKSFLHDHLLEGLNCKLAAGIISETINIADAIRGSKVTVSQENLATWDNTLKAFETLGMKVGFLRARLEKLTHVACRSQEAVESKRYRDAELQRVIVKEEARTLETRLLEMNEAVKRLDAEIEDLKMSPKRLDLMFREEASAPW